MTFSYKTIRVITNFSFNETIINKTTIYNTVANEYISGRGVYIFVIWNLEQTVNSEKTHFFKNKLIFQSLDKCKHRTPNWLFTEISGFTIHWRYIISFISQYRNLYLLWYIYVLYWKSWCKKISCLHSNLNRLWTSPTTFRNHCMMKSQI